MEARIPRIYKAWYLCTVTGYYLPRERSQGAKFLLAHASWHQICLLLLTIQVRAVKSFFKSQCFLSHSRNSLYEILWNSDSLQSSQQLNSWQYAEPDESSPITHIPFLLLLVQVLVICPHTYLSRLVQLLIKLQLSLQLQFLTVTSDVQ
jgi:hypothetical protein